MVHKADLWPDPDQKSDHVAVDEAVIRLNDEQYWLYAAVDPEPNELLHTRLEPITNRLQREVREHHNVALLSKNGNYTYRLDERVESDAITHHSGSTLRPAEAAFDAHGALRMYYRPGDTVTHTGIITDPTIDSDPDSEKAKEFRQYISEVICTAITMMNYTKQPTP